MSKYELIGSLYRQYEKQPYQNEQIISLEDIPLNSLENIDKLTSSMTTMDLIEMLPEKMQDKNHFSIRVWNHYSDNYYYVKTIFDNPEINSLLMQIQKKTVLLEEGYKTLSLVPICPLVNSYWKKIEDALNKKDLSTIGEYFSEQSKYYFKLERYLESGYDYGEKEKALENLKLEFRDYRIFRKVYVKENYYTKATPKNSIFLMEPQKKSKYETPHYQTSKPSNSKNMDTDTDFILQMTHNFNTQGEKEEFLEPEEYAMCNPGFYDSPAPKLIKTRSKKPRKSSRDEN